MYYHIWAWNMSWFTWELLFESPPNNLPNMRHFLITSKCTAAVENKKWVNSATPLLLCHCPGWKKRLIGPISNYYKSNRCTHLHKGYICMLLFLFTKTSVWLSNMTFIVFITVLNFAKCSYEHCWKHNNIETKCNSWNISCSETVTHCCNHQFTWNYTKNNQRMQSKWRIEVLSMQITRPLLFSLCSLVDLQASCFNKSLLFSLHLT